MQTSRQASQRQQYAGAQIGMLAFLGALSLVMAGPVTAGPATLTFDPQCAPGPRIVVAAVGDLLFHDALQQQALQVGGNFRQFFQPVADVLAGADVTYGNLEGPAAAGVRPGGVAGKDPGRRFDGIVYGRTGAALIFNYHPSAIADLKAVGFSVVSTANNHAADRGGLGIDRTIDALEAAGLAWTGTRRRGTPSQSWSTRTSANGLTIAWLACTYGLNGMPDPARQALNCYTDKAAVMAEVTSLAADPAIDAVILTPHWGLEGSATPLAADRAYAREAVEAGATAIIGTHPHVLQPWEKIVTASGREALVVYSTGNFVSNQPAAAQRRGGIVLVEIVRPQGARARIAAAGFVATYVDMKDQRGHRVTELGGGAKAETAALQATLAIWPAGNRVAAKAFRRLPRACEAPAVMASAVAPTASLAGLPDTAKPAAGMTMAPTSAGKASAENSPDDRLPATAASASRPAIAQWPLPLLPTRLRGTRDYAGDVAPQSGTQPGQRPPRPGSRREWVLREPRDDDGREHQAEKKHRARGRLQVA